MGAQKEDRFRRFPGLLGSRLREAMALVSRRKMQKNGKFWKRILEHFLEEKLNLQVGDKISKFPGIFPRNSQKR